MKKLFILTFTIILCVILVGCGKTENNTTDNINDNTKVSTIAESYSKYLEIKSVAFEKLSESIPEDNYTLALGLLGFSSIDISMIPITMCGLDDKGAEYFYSLYTNLEYKNEPNKCTLSFKSDGKTSKYISIYDKNTDSVQTKMYEDDKLLIITEYVKLDEGYGTQQYFVDDDSKTSYRSIFSEDYIAIGFFEDLTSEPASIYKNNSLPTKAWTKGGTNWSEYDNGKIEILPNE